MNYDYAELSKEDLVRHCLAYSESLHELANEVMKLQWKLQMLQKKEKVLA